MKKMVMQSIIVGLLLLGGGVLLMIYSTGLVSFFGVSDWAERTLGSTRNMYVLLGLFIILVGCLFLFGVLDAKDMNNAMEVQRDL